MGQIPKLVIKIAENNTSTSPGEQFSHLHGRVLRRRLEKISVTRTELQETLQNTNYGNI